MVALNPKVDSPLFAAIVAAVAPLQHYQVDLVLQPLGLGLVTFIIVTMPFHNTQYIMGYNIMAQPHGLTMSL